MALQGPMPRLQTRITRRGREQQEQKMKKAVILSEAELFTIAAALVAVSPSGGSSDTDSLAQKIAAHLPGEELYGEHVSIRAIGYITTAHREYVANA